MIYIGSAQSNRVKASLETLNLLTKAHLNIALFIGQKLTAIKPLKAILNFPTSFLNLIQRVFFLILSPNITYKFDQLFRAKNKANFIAHRFIYVRLFISQTALLLFVCTVFCATSHALEPNFNQIVDAIYKAEGGVKAQYPYGVVSVKTSNPRKVCLNTVRNNYTRWLKSGQRVSYLKYLSEKYCPIGAANDPKGLNQHWLKNVEYFLKKEK